MSKREHTRALNLKKLLHTTYNPLEQVKFIHNALHYLVFRDNILSSVTKIEHHAKIYVIETGYTFNEGEMNANFNTFRNTARSIIKIMNDHCLILFDDS